MSTSWTLITHTRQNLFVLTWHLQDCKWSDWPGPGRQLPLPLHCHFSATELTAESLQQKKCKMWLYEHPRKLEYGHLKMYKMVSLLTLMIEKIFAAWILTHSWNSLGSSNFRSITFRTQKGYKALFNFLFVKKFSVFSFHKPKGGKIRIFLQKLCKCYHFPIQNMTGIQAIC